MKNKDTLKIVLDSMKEFKIIGTSNDEVIAEKIINTIYSILIHDTKVLEIETKNLDTIYSCISGKGMEQINNIIDNKLT